MQCLLVHLGPAILANRCRFVDMINSGAETEARNLRNALAVEVV